MFSRANGLISPIYRQWAEELTRRGYVFLLVDSFGPRHHGEMCSIGAQSLGRPAQLPQGDFRAAVAFYPGACNEARQPGWTSTIPLLVLMGAEDVWTPAAPCQAFLAGVAARGSRVEQQLYPGAYHGFDAPNQPRRELPEYVTRAGVVPIVGTDQPARQDALARVPAFLGRALDDRR